MSNFQTILVAVFLAFFVFAVLIFSGIINIGGISGDKAVPQGKIVVWGTFSEPDVPRVFEDLSAENRELNISYIRKPESTYAQSLLQAFAAGTGPDIFFITPDMVIENEAFVFKLPYENYPEKTFRDAFVDGSDVFLASDGVIGFPMVVDPLVLYYNRDILSNEGIATPPVYWNDLFPLVSRLTKKRVDGAITQSLIPLGLFDNVNHAKDIIATLFLQSGNPIMKRVESGYTTVLSEDSQASKLTGDAILDFFTSFSDPSKESYTWNRALPTAFDMFTAGKSAFYLGRASELFRIQSANPNLSFDVTQMLQTKDAPAKRTFGQIYAIAVNKKSMNATTAFTVAGLLSSGDMAKNFAAAVSLPPASRTLVANRPKDPYLFTFFDSAVITRSWLDPNTKATDAVFGELVQNVVSNKLSSTDAISKTNSQLELLIPRQQR